ncbi:MAG: hypothetical protein IPH35_10055 [Rhodoferax sp.]|nr:hypothetical protein [Rhodoferax sp.]
MLDDTEFVELVPVRLERAWKFLAGEERDFVKVQGHNEVLRYAAFSYFIPVESYADNKFGGVAVLVERDDAHQVAGHMFGLMPTELQESDLQDACAEVCNIFADTLILYLSGTDDINMGLPVMATEQQYQYIVTHFIDSTIYASQRDSRTLFVGVYYGTRPQR